MVRRLALAVVVATAVLGTAPAAHAVDYVVAYSDAGDYIGGGLPRVWTTADSDVRLGGTAAYVSVSASGGPSGISLGFEFAAQPGHVLQPGYYDGAQRAPFREPGHPGIDIFGDGRGCNETTGRFEVRDIATDAAGVVTRLWVIFEQHCEGGSPALWGEVRIGEPPAGGAAPALPTTVRWPPGDLGGARTPVPVTVVGNGGPVAIQGVAIGGPAAGDFTIREETCSGQTTTRCQVWIRFAPSVAGTREATLTIADAGGGASSTLLQGWSYGGVTKWQMTSDAGDYIGGGASYTYTPANARLGASGSRAVVGMGVDAANGDWWGATFDAPDGDIIAPGTFADAHRYPFNGSGPGLDVSGSGRGCNELTGSFTINEAQYRDDGYLRTLDVSFEQHCEGATPALRGRLQWRAGDTTPLPPWMPGESGTFVPTGPPLGLTLPVDSATLGSVPPPAAPAAAPRFRLRFVKVARHGRALVFRATFPGPGRALVVVSVKPRGAKRAIRLGSGRVSAKAAANRRLVVALSRKGLRRIGRARRMPLTARVTFTPQTGKAVRSRLVKTLRLGLRR